MDTRFAVQQRVIELCANRRWAFHALANFSGIPSSTLKNIVNGESRNPGIVTIKKICDGLGISLAEFFDTEEFHSMEQENE